MDLRAKHLVNSEKATSSFVAKSYCGRHLDEDPLGWRVGATSFVDAAGHTQLQSNAAQLGL